MKPLLTAAVLLAGLGSRPAPAQTPAAPAPPASYHPLPPLPVGGDGGWDYLAVDAAARRLYASHGSQVEVLDLTTRQKIGVIPNTPGVHGIALVPKLGRGYITCGRTNVVTTFDLRTLAVTGTVPTGARPDDILYDDFSGRLFVFNNGGGSATVVDPKTSQVVGTVALGGAAEAGASDGAGTIFVNLEDKSEVVVFDARTLAVRHRWAVAPGQEPTGLALDRAHHRLFSVCGNGQAVVLDSRTGQVVARVPIGRGVDGVVFDAARQVAVCSNGEGTLTVIHEKAPARFEAETIPSVRGARTLALDAATHHLLLPTATYGPAPAATAAQPHPRPSIVPGTFQILEFTP